MAPLGLAGRAGFAELEGGQVRYVGWDLANDRYAWCFVVFGRVVIG